MAKKIYTSALAGLTKREHEIACMIAEGKTNRMIADDLYISIATVNTHRQRIFSKLEVHNIASLVKVVMDGDSRKNKR